MQAYSIEYHTMKTNIHGKALIDAKNVKSAKNKLERKLRTKIRIDNVSVVGYY